MPVQAKTWFPSKEMQKSPNPSNEPLCISKRFPLYKKGKGPNSSANSAIAEAEMGENL